MPKKRKILKPENWNFIKKLIFRFLIIYFAICLFPFPLDYIPGSEYIFKYYNSFWEAMTPWVGESILGLDYHFSGQPTGSGDKTHNYVQIFIFTSIALFGSVIWSIRNPQKQYDKLYEWFIVYIRYFLSFMLLSYGYSKVFPSQFPDPWLYRYVETYGDLSPMWLIVSFMGHSSAYVIFLGLVEVIAGTLLLFKRTAIFGALIAFGFMINMVVVNFAYDVPDKLFSFLLLFQAFIILASEWKGLLNLFSLDQEKPKTKKTLPISDSKWSKAFLMVKIILIGYIYYTKIDYGISNSLTWEPRPKLYGLYDVEIFEKNGETIPPLVTDYERWRNLTIDKTNAGAIRMMNDDLIKTRLKIDTVKHTIKIFPRITSDSLVFKYQEFPTDSVLILKGRYHNNSLYMKLSKMNIERFRVRRKFQWVHERPYDR